MFMSSYCSTWMYFRNIHLNISCTLHSSLCSDIFKSLWCLKKWFFITFVSVTEYWHSLHRCSLSNEIYWIALMTHLLLIQSLASAIVIASCFKLKCAVIFADVIDISWFCLRWDYMNSNDNFTLHFQQIIKLYISSMQMKILMIRFLISEFTSFVFDSIISKYSI